MADGNEYALHIDFLDGPGVDITDPHGVDALGVAQHFVQLLVPFHRDIGLFQKFLLHDLLGAQFVAPVHHGYLAGDIAEIQRFLHRGVAAADDSDRLLLVEKTVAGGAGGDAFAHELLFRFHSQVAGGGARRDDERVAGISCRVAFQAQGALAQVRGDDLVEDDFGLKTLRVLLEAFH